MKKYNTIERPVNSRKVLRNKARYNMKKAGYSRVNKGDFFAKHWKEFI